MSDLFDKITDTFIIAGKELENSTRDLTEKAKLKYDIHTRESYLDELYKELGKEYYVRLSQEEKGDNETVEEIGRLLGELKDLRRQINDKNGAKYCRRCGAQMAVTADYCPKCGEYQDPDKEH